MNFALNRRALLASSAAFAGAASLPSLAGAASAAPVARVTPVTETLFGTTLTDPYRWMEAQDAEWKAYVLAQGEHAKQVLDVIPGRDAVRASISGYTKDLVAVSGVQVGGDLIFTEVRPAGAQTYKLYVRQGLHGADRMLIDPDVYATTGSHTALDWWSVSPDGSHVVFGVSPGGSEESVARIMVTQTGAILPEMIDRTQFAGPGWAADSSGFFFTRLKAGTAPGALDKYNLSVNWYHRLGTDPAGDIHVLSKKGDPNLSIADIDVPSVGPTPGSDLVIGAVNSGVQNEIALYVAKTADAQTGSAKWVQVCSPADKVTGGAVHGEDIYLLSHAGASRYQILKSTSAKPAVGTATVAVPQSDSVIRGLVAAKDAIYIQDLNAGIGGLRRMTWDGQVHTLALPFAGSIAGLYADTLHDGAWFLLQGWVRPSMLCYAAADGTVTATDIAPTPPIDVAPYASEEVFATAADGTKVPLSIIYKKGLRRDGGAPVLLEAYGSYGITLDPGFLARWLPFLDLGGVFAVAHVRGGGELGEDWHLAGQKLNKPNTWRDMIAAGEYLIAAGYTRKSKLAIVGGSAGGITVGRFVTERPDLAAVVISQVGVSNATRSEFSPNGPGNIPEFGSVTDAQGFKGLLEMDAMQHVKKGVAYPSIMLTTGLNDPRVPSWEPTKMTARLQAATGSKNPVILRIETDAGHGIGSTRDQRDRETGDIIAFILWRTGDKRFLPKPS